MSITLRAVLIIGAALTMAYVLVEIRKSRLQITYALSWGLFSALLVLLAIFPGVVSWWADRLGVMSPANLLYLAIVFILILRQFRMTIHLSRMNRQITELTQFIALKEQARPDAQGENQTKEGIYS